MADSKSVIELRRLVLQLQSELLHCQRQQAAFREFLVIHVAKQYPEMREWVEYFDTYAKKREGEHSETGQRRYNRPPDEPPAP